MLKCRHVIEHFSKTNKSCKLLLRKWNALEEMKDVLHVPYLTTILLQKNDFTLSDFFGCFQIIEIALKRKINSPQHKTTNLAQRLMVSITNRKSKLMDTPLMISAIFLDPRYKCTIESDHGKVQLAKLTIERIYNRLKSVKGIVPSEDEQPTAKKNTMEEYYADLDEYLNQTLGIQPSSDDSDDANVITNLISKYESSIQGLRLKSSDSVHAFWESKKSEYGVLYEIACIIFAVPPTQASVERNFSGLKYMLTDKRYNLRENLLESLLLIHLNRENFNEIQKNEIEKENLNSL